MSLSFSTLLILRVLLLLSGRVWNLHRFLHLQLSILSVCKANWAKHFGVTQSDGCGCRTYGGHGEAMAVFASTAKVAGTPLTDLIGTAKLTNEQWADIKQKTIKVVSNIIKLSWSFLHSRVHLRIRNAYDWGCYGWWRVHGQQVACIFRRYRPYRDGYGMTITKTVQLMKKLSVQQKRWIPWRSSCGHLGVRVRKLSTVLFLQLKKWEKPI